MAQPLFGIVQSGSPVIFQPTEKPSETTALYAMPPPPEKPGTTAVAEGRGHRNITVFILPEVTFPPGTAAAIYLVTPSTNNVGQTQLNYTFVAGIGPGKESVNFKLNSPNKDMAIGIALEPAQSVSDRVTAMPNERKMLVPSGVGATAAIQQQQQQEQRNSTLVLAQRIIQHAFNYLSGCSSKVQGVDIVALKAFEDWWKKFETKVRNDPSFLERMEK